MAADISDDVLQQLLDGELSAHDEERIEKELTLDAELRLRLERLSGGDDWPQGSTPVPFKHHSDRLAKAIESVDHYLSSRSTSEVANQAALPAPLTIHPPCIPGIVLIRELGRGGMGVVFEGLDESLGRRVAIKFIEPLRAANANAQERLLREAQSTAALQHENIVSIYSIQNLPGQSALVQQFIDGHSLQERIDRDGMLPIEECIDLGRQLARGLTAAHAAGIVHRDLKPGNILLETETKIARIADFGMAQRAADSKLTAPDVVSGTPAFMSPEQTLGQPVDPRSDLFSLGSILFTITTGGPPFQGDDPFAVMDCVRRARVPNVQLLRPEVPAWFAQIIQRLLAKQPDRRIQSAIELLNLLETRSAPNNLSLWAAIPWIGAVTSMMLMLVIVTYQIIDSDPHTGSAGSSLPAASRAATRPKVERAIWILGQTQEFPSLTAAISAAKADDTIFVSADLETEQIDIAGKRLTIAAAPKCRPVLCPSAWAKKHSPILFRTDSDLTLRGLVLDWRVDANLPLSPSGKVNAVVLSTNDSNARLVLQDCAVFRNDSGICIGATGDLTLERCWIGGGEFAIGWLANQSQIKISDTLLQCKTTVTVMFPAANMPAKVLSRLTMEHCSIVGENFVDFMITRIPERIVEIIPDDTVFDVAKLVQISAANSLSVSLNAESPAKRMLRSCLNWRESDCTHSIDTTYLACRRVRILDRWTYTGITNLDDWSTTWPNDASELPAVTRAVETKINSTLPKDRRELPILP